MQSVSVQSEYLLRRVSVAAVAYNLVGFSAISFSVFMGPSDTVR